MTRNLAFPFQIGDAGPPRTVELELLVRQQLEQLLFTLPGERVNRPDYGCGVQRLVFAGTSPETIATAEYVIALGVRRHLSNLLRFDAVKVWVEDATLHIDLLYTLLDANLERALSITRPLEGPS
ncbi:MAG TPA: GPW/gp25 family protein [Myxococcota bacterium]|nr:GPW/gp25 family protein [Myxococcota bacterium]HND29714.1 GPW/gp25 family protein [Myxococcota bacterium]